MKKARKIVSVLLSALMLTSSAATAITANASTDGTLCDKYATNPGGKVGKQGSITIDGNMSDWSSDMLIAQGAAWDVANHYKGGHENCVLDTYALFASWDNSNLYVAWQLVNTTDTWAREGDGPLSDGGRVLDVPLILALSVDPSSTSMSNKNTSGNPIWGQKMGLKFDTHVDHLFYMSGKPGLGQPAMFTAVDAQGNTNYEEGCHQYKAAGIEYKMAEGNICDSIWGLNFSEDTADVYDSSADWVDYKTFKGSSATHNTKYDSFYEMKIPLSLLGIDASYLTTNGIGAMLVATRGESALDCIPFDDTMLDNVTGDYSNDPSTSAEKDDIDTITSSFAMIGKGGQVIPTQPTTKPTEPTTKPTQPTTQPAVAYPMVVATSNLFPEKKVEMDDTFTVTYDLKSAMKLANGQWTLSYDTEYLSFDPDKNADLMPFINSGDMVNTTTGKIYGAFSDLDLYDFSASQPFVEVTFDVKKTIDKAVYVDLQVEELSVGYVSNGQTTFKNAVKNSAVVNLSNVSGFTGSSLSYNTSIDYYQVSDTLTVKAKSNLDCLTPVSQEFDKDAGTVTVTYKLKSTMNLVNGNWFLTYDSSKLQFDKKDNVNAAGTGYTIMPNVNGAIINPSNSTNTIGGIFSNLATYDFTTEKDFVTVTFKAIGKGVANVNLEVKDMSVGYINASNNETVSAPIVKDGNEVNVTSVKGFEKQALTGKITFTKSDAPAFLLGDVDGNGSIDISDATAIQFHLSKATTLDSAAIKRADVDGNGNVDINDVTRIQFYLAKSITSF